MDINRTIFYFNFFDILKKKLLSAYTETTLNGDFKSKSAIIFKNTNTEKFFLDSYLQHHKRWFKPKNHLTLLSL
jgi:hypothetical protein